ncbi:MAG: hypothetical protein O3A00_04860, partial [Planctomycetota bacterium]|nr:hypothetical protein [Planctomycetota bacterium]
MARLINHLLKSISLLSAKPQRPSVDRCTNLLPHLLADRQLPASENRATQSKALVNWLQHLHAAEARLTVGLGALLGSAPPNAERRVIPRALPATADRLVVWRGELEAFDRMTATNPRCCAIVSSRLSRSLENHGSWFAGLRTACSRAKTAQLTLVTATATTCDPYVRRCAELFGIDTLTLDVREHESPTAWLRRVQKIDRVDHPTAFVSPCLDTSNLNTATNAAAKPDQLLVDVADQVVALSVRTGGNLERILTNRLLREKSFTHVLLARGAGLVRESIAQRLETLGAVSWHLLDAEMPDESPTVTRPVSAPIIPLPDPAGWVYLAHCTRRRTGAWPSQDETDFLDDLILDRRGRDHGCFAALSRIVSQRRLHASPESVRGDVPVVCFSGLPLAELRTRRVFRTHRGRWDFEPYGICIRQQWLKQCGARPVIYGDDEDWDSLTSTDRPFFQRAISTQRDGTNIDWATEREWRHVGSLDLSDLPRDDAFV